MCSDGVGRTGAFISTHAEMERMKAETVVDLFQFIKAARTQRKGLVSNKVRDEHAAICSSIDLLGPPSYMCALVTSIICLSRRISMSFVIMCWLISLMDLTLMLTSKRSYS